MSKGIVYLIGAGPGDPGLITVRGQQCLARSDVVVYDYLAPSELLKLAPAGSELIYVGKKAGQHTLPQEEINALLAERARAGHTVARLKGGDPFIFGRGGEEAQFLVEAGVRFEVVPGISSAIAAPAYAGIPLTHRDLAASFAVITGHRRADHESTTGQALGLDWAALSSLDTLVFLMGVGNLPVIVENLLAAGWNPETPVALVRWGTTPRQQTVEGTLREIVARVREAELKPPAVIVVGRVAALGEELGWFDRRPLFGRSILVTRSRAQASVLSQRLRELGAQPIEFPTIRIVPPHEWAPLDSAIEDLSAYDWVIFTSTNGVSYFWQRLREAQKDSRALAGISVGAIGPATAAALQERGVRADLVPARYVAEAILEEIGPVEGRRVLLARADIARPALAEGLRAAGAEVDEVTAYRTLPGTPEDAAEVARMIAAGEIDILTFTSSSTVRNFFAALEEALPLPERTIVACIGPITAQTAREHGLSVDIVASEYTIEGLVEALVNHMAEA